MKKKILALFIFIFPSFMLRPVLRMMGVAIGKKSTIGFSFVYVDHLEIKDKVRIGHFNLILNNKVFLDNHSKIGFLNVLKGPFDLDMAEESQIGNKNYLTRGRKGISYGYACLKLGKLTKITVSHHIDLTRNISFGDFSILAGIRSQMWTHGYYHAESGKGRIRIDGSISIGNNVYIGSGCIFNPGVSVNDTIHVGGGSVISKDLNSKGMYVGQALRHIDTNYDDVKRRLNKVDVNLMDKVYSKDGKKI